MRETETILSLSPPTSINHQQHEKVSDLSTDAATKEKVTTDKRSLKLDSYESKKSTRKRRKTTRPHPYHLLNKKFWQTRQQSTMSPSDCIEELHGSNSEIPVIPLPVQLEKTVEKSPVIPVFNPANHSPNSASFPVFYPVFIPIPIPIPLTKLNNSHRKIIGSPDATKFEISLD